MTREPCPGFTLVEVMVALAVLAISLVAALGTVRSAATNAAHLYDVVLSGWTASNAAARLRIEPPEPENRSPTDVSVMMYGRPYRVRTRFVPDGEEPDDPAGEFRITVSLPDAGRGPVLRETRVRIDADLD